MAATPKDCPCGSGARFAACCRPLHLGTRTAESPEALMRARFSAYATGAVEFIRDTLHPSHPDLAAPADEALRELRQTCARLKFPRLHVLGARETGPERGQVLFWAEVFEQGKDRSFVECSDFERVGGHWLYQAGAPLPASQFPAPGQLDFARFEAARQS